MNDATTREIMKTSDEKPSVWMPCPMSNNGVNKSSNHDGVDDVGDKIAAFR